MVKYSIFSDFETYSDNPTYYKTIAETRRALYSKLSRVDRKYGFVVMDVIKYTVIGGDFIAKGIRRTLPNGQIVYMWRAQENIGKARGGSTMYQHAGSYVLNKDGTLGKLLRPKDPWEVEYV